jgi:DNA-directed RNA polymerase beta' subunit
LPGEYIMLNRAPSLHKYSSIYLKIVPTNGNTIKLNPGICEPFNADFDGDEMVGYVPYSK